MVDLIERIGPYLGIGAFLGLSILAFLIFQQAREVRRLREWAGRAPERKADADEAVTAAAEARGEEADAAEDTEVAGKPEAADKPEAAGKPEAAEEPEASPGRFGTWWQGVREAVAVRFAALDRGLPLDLRYLLAVLAAGIVAAAVLTSGFGLVGDDDGGGSGGGDKKAGGNQVKEGKVEVAILNATQEETSTGVIEGVAGLADLIGDEVVKPAGYNPTEKENAASGLPETTIFVESGSEADAEELAAAVSDQLGEPEVSPMTPEVRDLAGDAQLALAIGQDNADFVGP